MAKRRRLIPATPPGFDPDALAGGEARAALAPGLGMTPPIARVASEAAAHAALDEVAGAMAAARAEGRLVLTLPLAAIDSDYLVRDRLALDGAELAPLIASLRDHGQRMPVEVADLGAGRYGLISGWRRVQALTRLATEGGSGQVLALLRRPAEASDAYVAMVEENEVRQGLSYYERARIAARAADLGVFESEKQALQRLFAGASRPRRSKIGSFISLYRALDDVLRHPAAISERLGLALEKALESRPEALAALKRDLAAGNGDPGAEMALLGRFVTGKTKAAVRRPAAQELAPGVFLAVGGAASRPVLTLSGPGVTEDLRTRLESWLSQRL